MNEMDTQVVEQYLDNAQLHGQATNQWAEGYWLGRAIEHVEQNAMDHQWLIDELETRGLDSGIVALPKTDADPTLN